MHDRTQRHHKYFVSDTALRQVSWSRANTVIFIAKQVATKDFRYVVAIVLVDYINCFEGCGKFQSLAATRGDNTLSVVVQDVRAYWTKDVSASALYWYLHFSIEAIKQRRHTILMQKIATGTISFPGYQDTGVFLDLLDADETVTLPSDWHSNMNFPVDYEPWVLRSERVERQHIAR